VREPRGNVSREIFSDDHSSVILKGHHDYINASYIDVSFVARVMLLYSNE
jgi:protein tyrosine phosphatase